MVWLRGCHGNWQQLIEMPWIIVAMLSCLHLVLVSSLFVWILFSNVHMMQLIYFYQNCLSEPYYSPMIIVHSAENLIFWHMQVISLVWDQNLCRPWVFHQFSDDMNQRWDCSRLTGDSILKSMQWVRRCLSLFLKLVHCSSLLFGGSGNSLWFNFPLPREVSWHCNHLYEQRIVVEVSNHWSVTL